MRRPHKAPRYERERRSTPHGGEAGTLRGLHYLQRYFGPQHDVIRAAYRPASSMCLVPTGVLGGARCVLQGYECVRRTRARRVVPGPDH